MATGSEAARGDTVFLPSNGTMTALMKSPESQTSIQTEATSTLRGQHASFMASELPSSALTPLPTSLL